VNEEERVLSQLVYLALGWTRYWDWPGPIWLSPHYMDPEMVRMLAEEHDIHIPEGLDREELHRLVRRRSEA
jgi:hypothetical protein